MKRTYFRNVLFFFIFVAQALFAADTGILRGTVTDPLAAVIQGAKVELSHDGKQISSTATGTDGRFEFSALAPGHYQVRASAPTVARLRT